MQVCYQCKGVGVVLAPSNLPFQDGTKVLPWNQAAPTGAIELTSTPAQTITALCNGCGGDGIENACGA